MAEYQRMTMEELDAANADLQARRLQAHEEFKLEATRIQSARATLEAKAKAEELFGDMSEEQKAAIRSVLDGEDNDG